MGLPAPTGARASSRHIVVALAGRIVADTTRAHRVLETSQPPAYYIAPADVDLTVLVPSTQRTFCEWKGQASYYDVVVGSVVARAAVWTYLDPDARVRRIRGHLAFYAQKLDCSVDDEVVVGNEGTFYGGWITSDVVGPFKGGAGTAHW